MYKETKEWLIGHVGQYDKGEEFDYLYNLIKKHPNYQQWTYQIPTVFRIENKIQLKLFIKCNNKFRIVSWRQCCSDIKTNKVCQLTSAMRQAVRRQITMYKKNNLVQQCQVCLTTENIEVDHYPVKFVDIKNNFVMEHTPPVTFKWHPKRGYYMFHNKDKLYKQQWQRYHLKHATYRYLCSSCNKKI